MDLDNVRLMTFDLKDFDCEIDKINKKINVVRKNSPYISDKGPYVYFDKETSIYVKENKVNTTRYNEFFEKAFKESFGYKEPQESKNLRDRRYIDCMKEAVDRIYINANKKTVVVKFSDGTTEKAKCMEDDVFDVEKGVLLCFFKKFAFGKTLGNKKRALEELIDEAWIEE